MFKSYVLIALRNFRKNKFFSLVNLLGLAVGISTSLVIYLIVQHELNFDTFHAGGDRIFRVVSQFQFADVTDHNPGVPVPTAKALREGGTGLELVAHFQTANEMKVSVPGAGSDRLVEFPKQERAIFCDDSYFKLIQYQWLAGTSENALAEPFRVVLTEEKAAKYFPGLSTENIVGRRLIYDDSINVTVAGVVRNLDRVTDFLFAEFLSRATVEHTGLKKNMGWNEWTSTSSASQLFVKLAPGTDAHDVEQQIMALRRQYSGQTEKNDNTKHFLQPLSAVHFDPDYGIFNFSPSKGNMKTLYGLLAVAGFLLLLGCINFVNLSTAQASQRAKEIGIRKTMGSSREQLVWQFLGETFVMTLAATILSVILVPLFLDVFRDFVPEGVVFSSLFQAHVWLFLAGLVVAVSILSGMYPGFVLARFQPVTILHNRLATNSSTSHRARLRKTLTVMQFVIAQFLIIATIVVSKQILYSINKELGYKRDAIVFFWVPVDYDNAKEDTRRSVLFQQLQQIPGITRISLSGTPPAYNGTSSTTLKVNNGKEMVEKMVEIKSADTSYFGLYGLSLAAGRSLTQSDTVREYVINETYAKALGLTPQEAITHSVERRGKIPIVGVVRDFHTKSTMMPIKPLAFTSEGYHSSLFHLALNAANPSDWKLVLEEVKERFQQLYPGNEFRPQFFDETIGNFYKKEQRISRLLNWAAGLAVFISCLGLLGLVIYTTNVRVKEIGVRKVLGASVVQIVTLLSRDFLSLVLAAFAVAAPLGGWAMSRWLEDYAYRTTLSWWVYALTGGIMVFIALLTLSLRTVRSASENPVNSLRSE